MSVYKRGDHWWFTKTIRGVRIRKPLPTARTKAQAEEAERHELLRMHSDRYGLKDGAQLLGDFIDRVYLPWAKANKRNPKNDENHCAVIKAFFKGKTFGQISPILIEKFKRTRAQTKTIHKTERAPASVNRELEVLSRIFSMAIDNGIAATNPCRRVKKLREDNRRNRYLTSDEEARLLAHCIGEREHLRPIIILAINTGMRRGDLLTLRWQQVDFERGLIFVPNLKAGEGRGHHVPMNSTVREELQRLAAKKKKADSVFAVGNIKRAFATACDKAEIRDLRFHDLRHTAATRLADAGADAFTIAAILGHSPIQMSARYTHATDDRLRRVVEALTQNPGHKPVTMKKRA